MIHYYMEIKLQIKGDTNIQILQIVIEILMEHLVIILIQLMTINIELFKYIIK